MCSSLHQVPTPVHLSQALLLTGMQLLLLGEADVLGGSRAHSDMALPMNRVGSAIAGELVEAADWK